MNGPAPRVPLTLACWDYDRTAALASGEVRPEGVDLTYLSLPVEETFFRMLRHREFDAAEMSLPEYVISLGEPGGSPFIASRASSAAPSTRPNCSRRRPWRVMFSNQISCKLISIAKRTGRGRG